jgi:hypothetical protein
MSTFQVRYPEVEVELVGHDGNGFVIMGRVSAALKRAGVPKQEVDEFLAECMVGDYDHLLQTCMRWVTVV